MWIRIYISAYRWQEQGDVSKKKVNRRKMSSDWHKKMWDLGTRVAGDWK